MHAWSEASDVAGALSNHVRIATIRASAAHASITTTHALMRRVVGPQVRRVGSHKGAEEVTSKPSLHEPSVREPRLCLVDNMRELGGADGSERSATERVGAERA